MKKNYIKKFQKIFREIFFCENLEVLGPLVWEEIEMLPTVHSSSKWLCQIIFIDLVRSSI
jgi:hypothetical protein